MPKIKQKNNVMTLKEFQNIQNSGGGGKNYLEKNDPPIFLKKDEISLKKVLKGNNLYDNMGGLNEYP
jgi:hypothetical protein